MTKCPNCFQSLTADAYAWVCTTGRCEQEEDRLASRYAGVPVKLGTRYIERRPENHKGSWAPTREVSCPSCKEGMPDACPVCLYTLEPDWRSSETTCVAMNGARATGKSIYIAVAITQLRQLIMMDNRTLGYANDYTRETFTTVYERPLLEAMRLMPPTPRSNTDNSYQRQPLIFSIGSVKGVRRYLVVRDVAGEEMESPSPQSNHLDFLAHADGIFFMFDPLAVPSIRDRLVDLIPAQLQLGGDPSVVLGNLLNILGKAAPRLSIVLSKFDALQVLRQVDDLEWSSIMSNAGAAFLRDPSEATIRYDEPDGELLHEEVKSLLEKLGAKSIIIDLENPPAGQKIPYRFFAVSALGESPNGRQISARGLAPFRALDPLKWVLSANGAI